MKNKKKIGMIVSVLFVVSLLTGITVAANTSTASKLENWGRYLNEQYYSGETVNDIYAKSSRISITNQDIEQVQEFYILSGMDEQSAWEEAVEYVMEREVLYQEALDNGYSVTDQEVWGYIEDLKKIIATADNKEDVLAVMSQFDTEEDYWNYEFYVYQKNLPIQNYVHDLEQAFKQSTNYSNDQTNDIESAWQQYFEQMKADLAVNEDYQVVSD